MNSSTAAAQMVRVVVANVRACCEGCIWMVMDCRLGLVGWCDGRTRKGGNERHTLCCVCCASVMIIQKDELALTLFSQLNCHSQTRRHEASSHSALSTSLLCVRQNQHQDCSRKRKTTWSGVEPFNLALGDSDTGSPA